MWLCIPFARVLWEHVWPNNSQITQQLQPTSEMVRQGCMSTARYLVFVPFVSWTLGMKDSEQAFTWIWSGSLQVQIWREAASTHTLYQSQIRNLLLSHGLLPTCRWEIVLISISYRAILDYVLLYFTVFSHVLIRAMPYSSMQSYKHIHVNTSPIMLLQTLYSTTRTLR